MSSETFEQVLTAAQADGSYTPAWKKFVKTKFFVPVIRPDGNLNNFKLRMSDIMGDGKQSILISEVRERVEQQHGSGLAKLYGGDVVRMLHTEASILVALSDRAFNIARDRVEWLKRGMDASQARVAAQARALAAPAQAVMPGPALPAKVASAPVRHEGNVLDVASLKPRNITLPKIGLDFFVPSAWRQTDMAKGLRFFNDQGAAVIEASGFHRPNVPMAQWLGMRLELVRHEMRYLQQDGQPYALEGELWRGRVKGMATEFTGTFPGENHASRFLLACFCIDGTLVCMTIKAPAESFELDRSLYEWLLGRVNIDETAAVAYRPPARGGDARLDAHLDAGPLPDLFGMSFGGRIGRVTAMAYSVPLMLPYLALALLGAAVGPSYFVGMGVLAGIAAIAMLWFSLRLLVMRMHDVSLSGKWLFAGPVMTGLSTLAPNPMAVIVVSLLFWVALLVIYCFLPGTPGQNDYDLPPAPNTMLLNLGAVAFVLLQLVGIGVIVKTQPYKLADTPVPIVGSRAPVQDANAVAWTSPDGALRIAFPATPRELELPKIMRDNLGGVQMHQYIANAQGRTYMVQIVDYGKTAADSLGTLEGIAMSIVGRDGVQVTEDRSLRYNGAEGREVRVAVSGGSMRSARFVIVGPRVYMAMASTRDDPAAMQKVDEFLASFALTPLEPK